MKTSDREVLKGYYWNHDAIRKDVGRLEKISDVVPNLSKGGFEKIKQWFDFHQFAIVEHHTAEDTFFFPKIAERTTEFEQDLAQFDHEHKALDDYMEKLDKVLNDLCKNDSDRENRDKLKTLIGQYKQLIMDHLGKEEQVVDRSTSTHFTKEEILKAEEEFRNNVPKNKMAKLMPWMVDAMDEKDRKFFFSVLPLVPRLLYKLLLRKKYERLLPKVD